MRISGPMPQGSPAGFGGSGFQSSVPSVRSVTIDQADYAAFEERLHAVQDAYSREDLERLKIIVALRDMEADLQAEMPTAFIARERQSLIVGAPRAVSGRPSGQIGRASCRERV